MFIAKVDRVSALWIGGVFFAACLALWNLSLTSNDKGPPDSITRTADGFGTPGATIVATVPSVYKSDPLWTVSADIAAKLDICGDRPYAIEQVTMTANDANVHYEATLRCRL